MHTRYAALLAALILSGLLAPEVEATAVARVRPAPELRDCFSDFAVTIQTR